MRASRPPRFAIAAACSALALACGASTPAPAHTPRKPAGGATGGPARAAYHAPPEPGALGVGAGFGDLIAVAADRLAAGAHAARAACLLRARPGGGYALAAELMPALHELPQALPELDAALQRARGPIRVLTAWGQLGALDPAIGLAVFTALPPTVLRAPAVAVIATDQGIYLRYSDAPAAEADGPFAQSDLAERLRAHARAEEPVLYVSAEAGVPVATVAALLRSLPERRLVALSQVLPPGTRLPPVAAETPPPTCPDGLPEPPMDSREGDLDPAAIVDALDPLRRGASECLASATADARAGGRLMLALRIAADGSVEHACVLQDGIGDASLAACVLQSARALRLPRPEPPGFVDVHVPLALTPQVTPQAALCE